VGTVFNTPDDGCCDTRNMYSSLAVNKYLYTVASVGFLFTLNSFKYLGTMVNTDSCIEEEIKKE